MKRAFYYNVLRNSEYLYFKASITGSFTCLGDKTGQGVKGAHKFQRLINVSIIEKIGFSELLAIFCLRNTSVGFGKTQSSG